MGRAASYTLTLNDSLIRAWNVTDKGAVYLSIAPTKDKPAPRAGPRDTTKRDTSKAAVAARAKATADSIKKLPKPPKPNPEADTLPIDLTVEFVDTDGHVARMPLSRYGPTSTRSAALASAYGRCPNFITSSASWTATFHKLANLPIEANSGQQNCL